MSRYLSVIIAVNNEERNIRALYVRLRETLETVNKNYEIIFVEDGSSDNSYMELCEIYRKDKSVNIIKLRKNFGQTLGLWVGMNFARSGIIITMDGDLQHDPQDILKLLDKISLGYDLVNGKKVRRADSPTRTLPSMVAKKLVCLFFGSDYYDINSTFRAYRQRIMEDIKHRGEAFRFLPLVTKNKNISFCEVGITCQRRRFGKTHYHFMGRLKRLTKDFLLLLSMNDEKVRSKLKPDHLVSELRFQ